MKENKISPWQKLKNERQVKKKQRNSGQKETMLKCPNCNSIHKKDDFMPSFTYESLIMCPDCAKPKTEWLEYVRTNIAEMRSLRDGETKDSIITNCISISGEDMKLDWETFKKGKIARNPRNHRDQRYINPKYVEENFRLKGSA